MNDVMINIPESIIESLLLEFSEKEKKELIAIGEEWLKGQIKKGKTDTGLWWQCPEVWKKIAKRRRAGNQTDGDPGTDPAARSGSQIRQPDPAGLEHNYEQARIDYISTENSDIDTPAKMTDEGFLIGRAVVTNVGVFPYKMEDGSVHYELRPPEEVFHPDSIKSLKMLAMTNDHPAVAVTVDNIKELQAGHLGDDIITDAFHISTSYTITDQNAIVDVNNGKRALSCGYRSDIENTSGKWMGVAYDAIQRNIRYNHVAIVDNGRAGDAARIRFDDLNVGIQCHYTLHNKDSIDTNLSVINIDNKKKEDTVSDLKTVKIDGVDYQAEANVVAAYTKSIQDSEQLGADKEQLVKDRASIEAARDQFKDENEKLKKDMEDLKSNAPANLEVAVQNRMVLLDAAKRADIEVTDEMIKSATFDEDIKKALIIKLFPTAKEKIDSLDVSKVEDKAYLKGRFDNVLENLTDYEAGKESVNNTLIADSMKNVKGNPVVNSYNKMVQDAQNAWKPKEEVK